MSASSNTPAVIKGKSINPELNVRVSTRSRTMFVTSNKTVTPAVPHSAPTDDEFKKQDIIPWGNTNLFPQTVYKEIKDSPVVMRGLNWQAQALYGGGIQVGKIIDYKDDGTEIFKPYKPGENTDWEKFQQRSPVSQYLMSAALDFYFFGIPFPEIRMTQGSSQASRQVFSLKSQRAMCCRFGGLTKDGKVKKIALSGEWNIHPSKEQSTVPCIDPFDDPLTRVQEDDSLKKFIFPLAYPSPGELVYPLVPWDSIRKHWLPIAKYIAEVKYNMMVTGSIINYVVEIADWYWPAKFPDWNEKPELKEKRYNQVCDDFDAMMAGKENVGKNIFVHGKSLETSPETFPGWKITPLEKVPGDGKFLDDSTEASLQMYTGIGVDPAIFGMVPGKSMSSPGGSDKRVAFNVYISMRQYDRDTILQPLYFIRDFNKWDPQMQFRLKYPLITTLDKGKETQQQTS